MGILSVGFLIILSVKRHEDMKMWFHNRLVQVTRQVKMSYGFCRELQIIMLHCVKSSTDILSLETRSVDHFAVCDNLQFISVSSI